MAGTNRTVTLKGGSTLTGEDAKKYGKNTIALNNLNTDATPAVIPVVPPVTAPQALEGAIKGSTDAFQAQLDTQAAQSKTQEQSSFEQLLSETLKAPTVEGLTSSEYAKKGGIDELTPQLTELNSQITAEQESLRTQTKELMKNTVGLESRALTEEANRLRTESLDRQAALSVTQLSLQGRYDSAKEIADRAVAAKFAEGQRNLDILGLAYNRNKSMFDKDEQRAFETAQADRQTKIEMESFKEKTKYAQMIQDSSPSAALDRALKSQALQKGAIELEALRNPPEGLDTATLERITKLPVGSQEKLVNAGDTIDQIQRIKEIIARSNVADLNNPFSEDGRLFQRLATDVADKMARERTGAVVTSEEQRNFKKILGLGLLAQVTATPTEINSELDRFITKHDNTRKLIDPTGDIRAYLGQTTATSEQSYVDQVSSALGSGSSSSIDSYLTSFGVK